MFRTYFPSTTLLENLVFPFRFRTNLRSKLSISYSTSKKLPTRRSISSVGSGAERTAMNVPKGEPGGNRKTTSPRVKKHLCPRTGCKRGQHSLSQYVLEVFSELKISWTRGESQKASPRVKKHLCPRTSCKKGATQLFSKSLGDMQFFWTENIVVYALDNQWNNSGGNFTHLTFPHPSSTSSRFGQRSSCAPLRIFCFHPSPLVPCLSGLATMTSSKLLCSVVAVLLEGPVLSWITFKHPEERLVMA